MARTTPRQPRNQSFDVARFSLPSLNVSKFVSHWPTKPVHLISICINELRTALRRLLEAIGITRRARDITTPSVADYVDHINTQTIDEEAAP